MFIKDGKRFEICNAHTIDDVQYPVQFFAREDNRLSVGVIEIPDPVRGNDEIEYTQEINEAPYVIITPKSQEQLDQQNRTKTNAASLAYLASTDWMITRAIETGKAEHKVPDEVLVARQAARDAVVLEPKREG